RKVILAMDGSQHCYRALSWYAENLNSEDDQLVFVYVAEPPTSAIAAGVTTPEQMTAGLQEAITKGKGLASEVTQKCSELGIKAQTRFLERIAHGAGPALVDLSVEENADLIVMGNRGIGTLRRTFMGSVSDYVLHHAHRPTIIVPPPKESGHH
ncbi:hypothetical protein BOX15_Mlig033942g2, partial [Macrostomum lignano]